MAEALTPKPEPAAHPPELPEAVPADEVTEVVEPLPRRPGPHQRSAVYPWRFLIAYGLLMLVGGAALAAFAVVRSGSGSDDDESWSAWKPTGSGLERAQEIAAHVGRQYRLPSGRQLVAVQAQPAQVQDVPLAAIALRDEAATGNGDISVLSADDTVLYVLCGLGSNCSIDEGTPSTARLRLLRREALELALYTFRYRDNVDIVVALLPPPPPERSAAGITEPPQTQALFFRPGDLANQLDIPLRATIPAQTPRPETFSLDSTEARRVEELTRSNLFLASFTQGQDASAFLVLDRMPK